MLAPCDFVTELNIGICWLATQERHQCLSFLLCFSLYPLKVSKCLQKDSCFQIPKVGRSLEMGRTPPCLVPQQNSQTGQSSNLNSIEFYGSRTGNKEPARQRHTSCLCLSLSLSKSAQLPFIHQDMWIFTAKWTCCTLIGTHLIWYRSKVILKVWKMCHCWNWSILLVGCRNRVHNFVMHYATCYLGAYSFEWHHSIPMLIMEGITKKQFKHNACTTLKIESGGVDATPN